MPDLPKSFANEGESTSRHKKCIFYRPNLMKEVNSEFVVELNNFSLTEISKRMSRMKVPSNFVIYQSNDFFHRSPFEKGNCLISNLHKKGNQMLTC